MQIRRQHNTDRRAKRQHGGNESQYDKRKPQPHMQTCCHVQEFTVWFVPFLPFILTVSHSRKPHRFAESHIMPDSPLWPCWSSKATNTFCQWVCPCVAVCPFYAPILWHSVRMCGFQCVRACMRQSHQSQTIPSASNSLVYLSFDQRAAAACPQVSRQLVHRMSWEEGFGFPLHPVIYHSLHSRQTSTHFSPVMPSAHCSEVTSFSIFLHPLSLSGSGLIYSSFQTIPFTSPQSSSSSFSLQAPTFSHNLSLFHLNFCFVAV